MITKPFLIDEFRALGMTAGDTIFVHSAYSTFSRAPGGVDGGPQTYNALGAGLQTSAQQVRTKKPSLS